MYSIIPYKPIRNDKDETLGRHPDVSQSTNRRNLFKIVQLLRISGRFSCKYLSTKGLLLLFLFACFGSLGGGDNLLRLLGRNEVVMVELHAEGRAALCHGG